MISSCCSASVKEVDRSLQLLCILAGGKCSNENADVIATCCECGERCNIIEEDND